MRPGRYGTCCLKELDRREARRYAREIVIGILAFGGFGVVMAIAFLVALADTAGGAG